MKRNKLILLAVGIVTTLVVGFGVYHKITSTFDTINRVGEKVETIVDHVDPENVNAVVEGTGDALGNAADKIGEVDTESITDSVSDKIDQIDTEAVNDFFKRKLNPED